MGKRFLLGGLIIVLLSASVTAVAALEKVSTVARELFPSDRKITVPRGAVVPVYNGGPETFLLIGSDRRPLSKSVVDRSGAPHSDTLMLVRFDPGRGQTSVLSIPRDLEVSITLPNGAIVSPAKINEAYTLGGQYGHGNDPGAALALATIKATVPGVQINGVVDTTFSGFMQVVGKLGCVYVNVDHRYYHVNSGTVADNFSSINLQPGYRKLCYTDALAYVRYRHTDSDFVRVARQQAFLRAAREQIGIGTLFGHLDQVASTIGRAMTTTFPASGGEVIRLLKLINFSQQKPLRQVKFRFVTDNTTIGPGPNAPVYVTTTPALIQQTVSDFLHGAPTTHLDGSGGAGSRGGHGRRRAGADSLAQSAARAALSPPPPSDRSQAMSAARALRFRLLYPGYQSGPAVQQEVHVYAVRDRQGRAHQGYTTVFQVNNVGGYYDVQGSDWTNPPLIARPNAVQDVGGRHLLIFTDGGRINLVAFKEAGALYWVNNTLLEDLSNEQMIDIARSMRPVR